jgi:HTH-type transcriptional regulator/antitoxin HigA
MIRAKRVIEEIQDELAAVEREDPGVAYQALIGAFPLVPIENREQNRDALTVMEKLITYTNAHNGEIDPDTLNQIHSYMKILGGLIETFEQREFPRGRVTGAEMLEYFMELRKLKQTDLQDELGGQSVVSDILRGERELNVRQIKALAKRFKVSPSVFL